MNIMHVCICRPAQVVVLLLPIGKGVTQQVIVGAAYWWGSKGLYDAEHGTHC